MHMLLSPPPPLYCEETKERASTLTLFTGILEIWQILHGSLFIVHYRMCWSEMHGLVSRSKNHTISVWAWKQLEQRSLSSPSCKAGLWCPSVCQLEDISVAAWTVVSFLVLMSYSSSSFTSLFLSFVLHSATCTLMIHIHPSLNSCIW